MATARLTKLLEELARSRVEFVLVGGLAAVAQGAPLTTFDVDIVHRRTEENVDLLLEFLSEHGAYHRGRPHGQRLPPSKMALMGAGHSLMMTDLGPLDLLGVIEGDLAYEDLESESVVLRLGDQDVRVLRLSRLVDLKRQSRHEKDRRALPVLEETLARIESGEEDAD